jgi:hypothetical protein
MRIAKQQESIDKGPLFDDDRLDPMDEYFTSAVERMRICKQDAAAKECLKRARSERRDLNVVPCSGQPVIPIDLKGKCVFPKKNLSLIGGLEKKDACCSSMVLGTFFARTVLSCTPMPTLAGVEMGTDVPSAERARHLPSN